MLRRRYLVEVSLESLILYTAIDALLRWQSGTSSWNVPCWNCVISDLLRLVCGNASWHQVRECRTSHVLSHWLRIHNCLTCIGYISWHRSTRNITVLVLTWSEWRMRFGCAQRVLLSLFPLHDSSETFYGTSKHSPTWWCFERVRQSWSRLVVESKSWLELKLWHCVRLLMSAGA